jgi:hypothetical protein
MQTARTFIWSDACSGEQVAELWSLRTIMVVRIVNHIDRVLKRSPKVAIVVGVDFFCHIGVNTAVSLHKLTEGEASTGRRQKQRTHGDGNREVQYT